MITKELVSKYNHIFGTDYTADANCLLAWTIEAGSGNVIDQSATGADGVFVANADWASGSPPNAGSSYYGDFPGGDDDVLWWDNDGTSDALDAANLSITAWVYRDVDSGAVEQIAARDNSGNATRVFQYRINTGDDLEFIYFVSNAAKTATSTSEITTGSWIHTAVTWDGAETVFYKNGVSDTVNSADGSIDLDNAVFSIAARVVKRVSNFDTAEFLNGKLDEVGLFNAAKDSTVINAIMDNGLDGSWATAAGGIRRPHYKGRW